MLDELDDDDDEWDNAVLLLLELDRSAELLLELLDENDSQVELELEDEELLTVSRPR